MQASILLEVCSCLREAGMSKVFENMLLYGAWSQSCEMYFNSTRLLCPHRQGQALGTGAWVGVEHKPGAGV